MKLLLSLTIIASCLASQVFAQSDTTNKFDNLKRKTGYWIHESVKGLDDPFPFTEYGHYFENRKSGLWTKIDGYGNIKSKESYYKGILNGKVQYFDKGRLLVEGYFRALDPDIPIDTLWVYDPNAETEVQVSVATERGALKHGDWKYFDQISGKLYKIETYQIDSLIKERYFVEGYATTDSAFQKKANAEMPHFKDPSGKKYQSGKVRKSLIK